MANISVPADLMTLLPNLSDLPAGFQMDEETRPSASDVAAEYGDAEEQEGRLHEWGFSRAAIRGFAKSPEDDTSIVIISAIVLVLDAPGAPSSEAAFHRDYLMNDPALDGLAEASPSRSWGDETFAVTGVVESQGTTIQVAYLYVVYGPLSIRYRAFGAESANPLPTLEALLDTVLSRTVFEHTPPPTATPTPEPTVAPTATPQPTPVPATAYGGEMLDLLPTSNADFGGIAYRVEKVEPLTLQTPIVGFQEGQYAVLYLDDPMHLYEVAGGVTVRCVRYDSDAGASEWIVDTRSTYRDITSDISRDEPISDIGHEAYVTTGYFYAETSGILFKTAAAWIRVHNVACMYQGLDEVADPTQQMIDVAASVAARAMTLSE